MATNFNLMNDKNLEQCVVTFLEKVDSLEKAKNQVAKKNLPPLQNELRTLQLWRSVISECLASFLYVFIVCGATSTSASAGSFPQTANVTAAASGFTVCVLTYCFQNLSGAHLNPAISIPMVVSRKITPLRGMLFVTAQCGGAIAGAALLYGVTVPMHYGNLNATVSQILPMMSPWERFSIEFVLTFLIVFTYCATMNGQGKWLGNSAVCMGLAYLSTGLVSMPTQNPIRAFGPAFVMNRWEYHWVFWFGPCMGGVIAALVFEIIFITHRKKSRSEMSVDGDSVSIRSEADTFDDLDKEKSTVIRTVNPNPYTRQMPPPNTGNAGGTSYYGGFHPMTGCKTADQTEPIYEGSRSMYTRSPPLTRGNLNRSQSVYTKTAPNHVLQHREHGRSGLPPLYPSQSLYPMMPSNVANAAVNQNQQNQQRSSQSGAGDSIYGTTKMNSRDIYGKIPGRHEFVYSSSSSNGGGSGTKKQDSSENSYNSYYINNTSVNSNKMASSTHVTRKNHHHHHHQNVGANIPDNHNSYYHSSSQPSPSSQY